MIEDKKIEELIGGVLSKGYVGDFGTPSFIPKTDLKTALFHFINDKDHLRGDFRKDPWPFRIYTTIDGSKFNITNAVVNFHFEPNTQSGLDIKSILISADDLEMTNNQIYKTIEINSYNKIPTPFELLTMAGDYLSSKKNYYQLKGRLIIL